METTIESIIQKAIIKSYEKNDCIFDLVIKDIETTTDYMSTADEEEPELL